MTTSKQTLPTLKFNLYDVVKVTREADYLTAVVIDYTFRWKDTTFQESEEIYVLFTQEGETLEVSSEKIERVGCLTPPFQMGQSVALHTDESQYPVLTGRIGTVQGSSWNPRTNEWGFAVGFSDEKPWFFMESELKKA